MFKLARIGIGIAAACAAGVVVYEFIRRRSDMEAVADEEASEAGGRLINFPAERPPFAEAAESSAP